MLDTMRVGNRVNRATARAVEEGARLAAEWRGKEYRGEPLPLAYRRGELPRLASLGKIAAVIVRKHALGIGAPPRVYATMSAARTRGGMDYSPLYAARFEPGDPYNGSAALAVAWAPIGDEWSAAVRGVD